MNKEDFKKSVILFCIECFKDRIKVEDFDHDTLKKITHDVEFAVNEGIADYLKILTDGLTDGIKQ